MESKEFWKGAEPLQFGRLPRLQVQVALIISSLLKEGFPCISHVHFIILLCHTEGNICIGIIFQLAKSLIAG